MQLTIDSYQTDVLREVLASALTQLRIESGRTDSHDFRVALHDRERIIEALIGKLPPVPTHDVD